MARTKGRAPGRSTPAPAVATAEPGRRRRLRASLLVWPLLIVLGAGVAFTLGRERAQSGSEQVAPPARGLPHTPDYHTLAVDVRDPDRLLLGTHGGLYRSSDGGVTWRKAPLGGKDTIDLERTSDGTTWVAGHYVLARSGDGGETWREVDPDGLPSLDVHGFAVGPDDELYAAVAGEGLYVSRDGGESYEEVTTEVGGDVYGLVAYPGRLLAADVRRGILASEDGGRTWTVAHPRPTVGLAASPAVPGLVLAAGAAVWRSEDEGASWRQVFSPGPAVGPVAWSASSPETAYAIVPDRRALYRTTDGGDTWRPV